MPFWSKLIFDIFIQDLVLTAVHCVYEAKTDCITVVAGDHDIKNPDPTEQLGLPESIVYHEDYNRYTAIMIFQYQIIFRLSIMACAYLQ